MIINITAQCPNCNEEISIVSRVSSDNEKIVNISLDELMMVGDECHCDHCGSDFEIDLSLMESE